MPEGWQEPEEEPLATVIYGPTGRRLRVWKEIGKRELGFRATDEDEDSE